MGVEGHLGFPFQRGSWSEAVIWESRYWKKPLIAMAERIEAAGKADKHPTDRRMVQIERDVFIGCYSVRKLIHAPLKLTDACRDSKVRLRSHLATAKPVRSLHRNEIDELYNLEAGVNEERNREFFCGRIIHSFTFLMVLSEVSGLSSFYFGSDLDRGKRLFRVTIGEVVRVFRLVGEDCPTEVRVRIDPVTGVETFGAH
jgi:hypothetical protein